MLSHEIRSALEVHGISTRAHVDVLHSSAVYEVLKDVLSDASIHRHESVASAIRTARSHCLSVIVAAADEAPALLKGLNAQNVVIAVIVVQEEPDRKASAALRALGAMDVCQRSDEANLRTLAQRGLDFRALLALELAHRCESKRLLNRELELLGQPPEQMSDDLTTFQPPPLPVGPTSLYDLDEASDAFERSYIDRVQQLCGSAREAAAHLGVSSATLSRRLRKEEPLNG